MKILADLHHEDLFRSFQLLGNRLGAEVYRPAGMDWFNQGIWRIAESKQVASQFLGEGAYPNFPGVTLAEAMETNWACMIVSHIHHVRPWEIFFGKTRPGVPQVFQVGNNWSNAVPQLRNVKYVLNSAVTGWPQAKAHVRYHPEFQKPPHAQVNPKSLLSMMHCPRPEANEFWDKLKEALPDWAFKQHGAGSELGAVPQDQVAQTIAGCGFLYHYKPGGDGYGFNLHQAWASGKPVLMPYDDYIDKYASLMMVDRMTSYDLGLGVEATASWLKDSISDYKSLSDDVGRVWAHNCDPDYEWEAKLKPFFEKIL